jgi:molecular chaperone GrpE
MKKEDIKEETSDKKQEEEKEEQTPDFEKKANEYYEQLLRLKAEFENYRKRIEKEKPQLIAWGKTEMVMRLLPLYEVVLQAHDHLNKVMEDEKCCSLDPVNKLCKGIEMIFTEFNKLFKSEQMTVMQTVGKPYDPMKHEVLGIDDGDESNDGLVTQELSKGFMFCDKVLKPAKVKIAKKKQEAKEENKEETDSNR